MSLRFRQWTAGALLVSTIASLLVGVFAVTSSASAASANQAVKGTGSAIYWIGADGKKYLFPNTDVWYTWFPDFKNVKKITNAELAKHADGGRITMRPGAKLVKFGTAADVFAVSRYSVLRPISHPTVAASLYGDQWGTVVKTMPDAYKYDYTIGKTVHTWSTWEYNVSAEYNGVTTPSDNIGTPSVGAQGILTTFPNTTHAKLYDNLTVTTKFAPNGTYDAQGATLTIYDQYGTILKTCVNVTVCETNYYVWNTGSTMRGFYSTLDQAGQRIFSNAFNVTVDTNWQNPTTFSAMIIATAQSVQSGSPVTVTALAPVGIPMNGQLVIQRNVNGVTSQVYACAVKECGLTIYPTETASYTAIVLNQSGQQVAISTPVNVGIWNQSPLLTSLTGSQNLWYTVNGDSITITNRLDNPNTAHQNLYADIWDMTTNSAIAFCDRTNQCSATLPKASVSGHMVQAIWTDMNTWKQLKSTGIVLP